jgi:hypothetical protein
MANRIVVVAIRKRLDANWAIGRAREVSICHDYVDGRRGSRRADDRLVARQLHAEGVMRTQDILIREGKVA